MKREKGIAMSQNRTNTQYLTMSQFRDQIIDWCDDTIRKKIREEGLPAMQDKRGYVFDREQVQLWFKRRTVKAG